MALIQINQRVALNAARALSEAALNLCSQSACRAAVDVYCAAADLYQELDCKYEESDCRDNGRDATEIAESKGQ